MKYVEIGCINKDRYPCVREGSKSCYSMSGVQCSYYNFCDSRNAVGICCFRKDKERVCFIEPYEE